MDFKWLDEDVARALEESLHLRTFVSVALSGMQTATSAVDWLTINRRIAKKLRRPDPYPTEEEFKRRQEDAERQERFAKEQARRGFPYLFSVATVRLWSILEVMVDDLVRRLLSVPEILASAGMPELKGPLLPFVNASSEERADLLAAALKQNLGVSLRRPGISRLEELLAPFALSGTVNETVRRVLVELWAVRNIVVHRGGVTDKRFTTACPWLGCAEGAHVAVTEKHFHIYSSAVDWYALAIHLRLIQRFEIPLEEAEEPGSEELQNFFVSTMERFLKERSTGDLTKSRD